MNSEIPEQSYSLAIIGGGPGGYIAAIRAAQAGLATILIEETDTLGGVCLNRGCIPTKSLLRSAEAFELAGQGAEYGFDALEVAPDFGRIMARSRKIPESLVKGIDYLMKKHRITVIHGHAALLGENRIMVSGKSPMMLSASDIILATGAHPSPIPGIVPDGARVLTSDDLLSLDKCPSSILIIGAGAIGVQFASFFATFGASVTIVDMADRILPFVDSDVSKRLAFSFRKRSISVRTGTTVDSINVSEGGCETVFSDNTRLETDIILVAAGYTGNIDDLGLDAAGVICKKGFITVDDQFRTSAPHIYAIGDCIGPPMLAHAASMEGERAVEAILGNSTCRLDPTLVPIVIYSRPQIAAVGLTENDARNHGYDILTGSCPFTAIGKAVAVGETEGFAKVIIDCKTKRFIGIHIIGTDADETIQEVVLAMHTEITADQLLNTIHPHPTLTEAVREATATALRKPLNT